MLSILFEDEYYVAINKPHGLLVHRSKIAKDATEFALQLLRDQIEQKVYPAHRLDRKTGGVLVFAKSKEADVKLKKIFAERKINKTYWAIVRGWIEQESGSIDKSLITESGKSQKALTHYKVLEQLEINQPVSKFTTGRFTWVEVKPVTGRMHQIRKHFAHIRHYIINDKAHGDCQQNKFFEQQLNINHMLLHAKTLSFTHPYTNKEILITADIQKDFKETLNVLQSKIKK